MQHILVHLLLLLYIYIYLYIYTPVWIHVLIFKTIFLKSIYWCKSNVAPIQYYLVSHIQCIQPVSLHHPAIISYRSVVIRMVGWTICAANQNACGPCHQWYFLYNADLMRKSFCFYPDTDRIVAAKFCTCHDSWAVVACAKLCSKMMARNQNRRIEISVEK